MVKLKRKKKSEMRLAPPDEFFLPEFPGAFEAAWDHFINRRVTSEVDINPLILYHQIHTVF